MELIIIAEQIAMFDRMFYEEPKREENWKIPVIPFYIGEHLDKKR